MKQGVIAGVFRQKGAAPWGITRAEKLQLSVFLPNDLSLEEWYAGVYGLPTVWPEVSMMGADNLRKVTGYDFHHLRRKYDVRSMWGDLDPQWRLLQSQLEAKGRAVDDQILYAAERHVRQLLFPNSDLTSSLFSILLSLLPARSLGRLGILGLNHFPGSGRLSSSPLMRSLATLAFCC